LSMARGAQRAVRGDVTEATIGGESRVKQKKVARVAEIGYARGVKNHLSLVYACVVGAAFVAGSALARTADRRPTPACRSVGSQPNTIVGPPPQSTTSGDVRITGVFSRVPSGSSDASDSRVEATSPDGRCHAGDPERAEAYILRGVPGSPIARPGRGRPQRFGSFGHGSDHGGKRAESLLSLRDTPRCRHRFAGRQPGVTPRYTLAEHETPTPAGMAQ